MLLTERLVLLLLDPRHGSVRTQGILTAQTLFAAALLAEPEGTAAALVAVRPRRSTAVPSAKPRIAHFDSQSAVARG